LRVSPVRRSAPEKLKTYQTSLGFFEQAIAAPSMKAALKAWDADNNLFHQGVVQAIDKVLAALNKAEQEQRRRAAALRAEIETVEKKLKAEEADWDEEGKRLKAALRRARD
jgi:colicin import membrane protein